MNSLTHKIVAAVLFVAIVVSLFAFSSCGSAENNQTDTSNAVGNNAFVCKKEDLTLIKDDVCSGKKTGNLLSNKAIAKATNSLVIGEEYYFVFAFYLDDISESGQNELMYAVSDFNLFNSNGIAFGGEVSRSDIQYGGVAEVSNGLEITPLSTGPVLGYIAIGFVPQSAGILHCGGIATHFYVGPQGEETSRSEVTVNVFESAAQAESAAKISVSNLQYGFSEDDEKEYLSVTFDMDVEKLAESDGEISCAIYMRYGTWEFGPWDYANIDLANTGKIKDIECDYGRMMAFTYNANTMGKRTVEIVLSFLPQSIRADSMDIELYIFGKNVCLSGNIIEVEMIENEY